MADRDDAGREAPSATTIAPMDQPYSTGELRFLRWLVRSVVREHRERQRAEENAA